MVSRQVKIVLDETFSATNISYLYPIGDLYEEDCFIFSI